MGYIIKSIPFFILLMGIEYLISSYQKKQIYTIKDTFSNLSCGILQLTTSIFAKAVMGAAYVFVYVQIAPVHIKQSFLSWIVAIIGVDFCYYIFHRMSHRIAFFWAFHVVHHQSEQFNLSVALRQSALGGFFSWIFYLPLALLGISPEMVAIAYVINLLYQFWIHTAMIDSCGKLESILNTPSHHRVHHGRDVQYLDKNYGGIFIIWDKLFKTFEPEKIKPTYGLTQPLKSTNPLWANIHVWVELFILARGEKGLWNKMLIFIRPPGSEKNNHHRNHVSSGFIKTNI